MEAVEVSPTMSSVLAANLESELNGLATSRRVRRPWLWFILLSLLAVVLVAGGGPILSLLRLSTTSSTPGRSALQLVSSDSLAGASISTRRYLAASAATTTTVASAAKSTPPDATHSFMLPPPPLPPKLVEPAAAVRAVDAPGAADPGGAARISESSPLIQGMIEAGFSRAQSIRALEAVGATQLSHVPKAIEWSLKQNTDKNKEEAAAAREVHTFDKMDFDGYALQWGDKHRTRTLEVCDPLSPSNSMDRTASPGGASSGSLITEYARVGHRNAVSSASGGSPSRHRISRATSLCSAL